MDMEELAARITKLEDIEAIKKLQRIYAYYVDSEGMRDEILDLFSDNMESIEIADHGVYLGKEGVKCLIVDSTRANQPVKTPSESVAKELLRDVLLGVDSRGKAVIVTTFSLGTAKQVLPIRNGNAETSPMTFSFSIKSSIENGAVSLPFNLCRSANIFCAACLKTSQLRQWATTFSCSQLGELLHVPFSRQQEPPVVC